VKWQKEVRGEELKLKIQTPTLTSAWLSISKEYKQIQELITEFILGGKVVQIYFVFW